MANIYELLELGIDPRPQFANVDEAKATVESKIRKLRQGAQSGGKAAAKERKIKQLQEVAADLTMEKLDAHYEEAKEEVKKKLRDATRYYTERSGGEIKEELLEKIAKKHKVTAAFILKELPNIHVRVEEVKELKSPKCKNKLNSQVQDRLLSVKREDLYDFLNYHGTAQTLAQLKLKEPKSLGDLARTLAGEFDKSPDLDLKSAGTKLAQLCREIFENQESKDDYDYYLNLYKPLSSVLNKVGDLAENNVLLPQTGEVLVAEINQSVRNVEESRRYLRWKCKELKVEWTETPDPSIANCIFCGAKIGASDEVCGQCGKKQVITCSKCGKKSRADSKFCTDCGQTFGDVKKASQYCDAALHEIEELNFKVARHFIDQAKAEGGNADEIGKANALLEKVEKEVGAQVQSLEECAKHRAYYQAKRLLTDIQKMYAGYHNESLEALIQDALTNGKRLFTKAAAASKESDCLQLCDQIEAICSDYPGLCELKDKFPLNVPTDVEVKIDNARRTNDILWNFSGVASGVRFTVVRKEYARPADPTDGEVIGSFSARSCTDSAPQAGREYYYAVFASRGSKVSKPGVMKQAVINLFDLENVGVRPGDGVVQFQWENHTNGTVRLRRKENGVPTRADDGIEVANITDTGVWDNDVENGCSYGYFLYVEYKAAGAVLQSAGLTFHHIVPEIPPQPVTYLLSEMIEGKKQTFRLEWDDDIRDIVKFYSSPNPLEWEEGTSVERMRLESKAAPLSVTAEEPGKGTVNIGNADEMYVTAVTMGKENCVIGASAYISNKQIFKVVETRLVHGDLHIFLSEWPKECGHLKVVYRNDAYPKSVNDKEAKNFICTKSMYYQSQTVLLRQILPKDYYVSIYGKLGGDKGYAPAVLAMFSNKEKSVISYKLIVKKGFGGKIKDVSLEFTNSLGEFQLPQMYVYKNTGFLPPDISVGEKVTEIEATTKKARQHVVGLGSDFSKNEYVRVFLKNSQDALAFELNAVTDLSI